MIGLSDITRIRVPRARVEDVAAHLCDMGRQGVEGVAFWAGRRATGGFDVLATIIPTQTGLRSDSGVAVRVDGDELFRMNVWLHQNQLQLVAQIHSHPGAAYHSDTDDDYAIMTTVGGLSIVVPNFGRDAIRLEECAVYRLDARQGWVDLSVANAPRLIELEET